ncbi:MAG: type VI secretion system baseplate subunit TssF [Planctomycetota bacterium]
MEAAFLDHFNRELAYLRQLGGQFAQEHPQIASRLGMDGFQCEDPYVERLLEGFAFLAARVHRRMDSEFPEFTAGLLESIYPHYTRPIPSATVVAFHPDPDEGSLKDGYLLPRGTALRGPSSDQSPTPIRFETTRSMQLWPIELVRAEWIDRRSGAQSPLPRTIAVPETRSALKLRFKTLGGLKTSSLGLDCLSLHLRGGEVAYRLLEALIRHARGVVVADQDGSQSASFPPSAIRFGGFEESESLFPNELRCFRGYRLLQEYFLLPEKFLFANLTGLQPALRRTSGDVFDVYIAFSGRDELLQSRLRTEHLALHCAPAVNLFRRRCDRINVRQTQAEQHLLVDRSRAMDFEVWSVESLHGHRTAAEPGLEFLPLYAPPKGQAMTAPQAAFYTLRREPRQASDRQREFGHRSPYLGTEVFITLTDSGQQPTRGDMAQLSASVLCTNRDLAYLTPAGGWAGAIALDGPGPVLKTDCLVAPTPPRPALADDDGDRCWRLIQHLQANALSLNPHDGLEGAALLRQRLGLYADPATASHRRQIDGLLEIMTVAVTRQLPLAGPIVYGRGVDVQLTFDEAAFEGGGVIVLAQILDRFFSQDATLNSFTQTSVATKQRGHLHRWPVRLGGSPTL